MKQGKYVSRNIIKSFVNKIQKKTQKNLNHINRIAHLSFKKHVSKNGLINHLLIKLKLRKLGNGLCQCLQTCSIIMSFLIGTVAK